MTDIAWLHPGQWPVYIGITNCPKAFAREMKRLKVDDPPEMLGHERANMTTHTFVNRGTLCFIIGAVAHNRKTSKEQYAALIAHEALHIVQQMQRELHSNGSFDDESEAYLLQYIVQHCLQYAWNSNKTRRVKPT